MPPICQYVSTCAHGKSLEVSCVSSVHKTTLELLNVLLFAKQSFIAVWVGITNWSFLYQRDSRSGLLVAFRNVFIKLVSEPVSPRTYFITSLYLFVYWVHKTAVYFDQQTGAPHAVCWLKSDLKQLFTSFSVIKCVKYANIL